jgi:hypothetical protein
LEAAIQLHTLKEKALKNIHLIDKKYTLENTLHDTGERMASIVAQNKLLQDQLAALNQVPCNGAPTLSKDIAWRVQQLSAEALPVAAGEGQGSNKTSPDVPNKSTADNDLLIPIRGGGGTTQYQPSTDVDDIGSDLPLSKQGGGFISHYHSPQRAADELPTVEDAPIPGRQDKSQQSMPPVYTSPDYLLLGAVYFPFPPSLGKSTNMYYPCPGQMSKQDQVQPIPCFDPKTQKQVLCTILRPTTWTFQIILEAIPCAILKKLALDELLFGTDRQC